VKLLRIMRGGAIAFYLALVGELADFSDGGLRWYAKLLRKVCLSFYVHSGRELLLAIGSALTIAVFSLALWLLPFKVDRDVSLSFRFS
jgi:hypothetical protein